MKQRITFKQLNQLDEEQQRIVRDWWKPEINDIFTTIDEDMCIQESELIIKNIEWDDSIYDWSSEVAHNKDSLLPLLNIGQIIQLIQEKGEYKFGRLEDLGFDTVPRTLGLSYMLDLVDLSEKRVIKVRDSGNELCDLLWEGVKKSLGATQN